MSTRQPHSDRTPLPGSERHPAPNAVAAAAPADAALPIEVTLMLRRRAEVPEELFAAPIGRDEFGSRYGADPADVDAVAAHLREAGADVIRADPPSRRIRVRGNADTLSNLFGTDLTWVQSTDPAGNRVTHRQRLGVLALPAELTGRVTAVLGLDDRPLARVQLRTVAPEAVTRSYTPPQLGVVYDFPVGTDGSGRTVAIIELGGGYTTADLDTYFAGLGIPTPAVSAVGVDGARNAPGSDPTGADGEVMLDIEVSGALAPRAAIVVYFAPNTDAGFVDAVTTAAHADPTPDAISISWGQNEDEWTAQARTALDQALVDAAGMGVTVTVAAGDGGSADRGTDGKSHADFPASSPHALGCGGTSLDADPTTGAVQSETVWNDLPNGGATGGGVSDAFARPAWQAAVGVPGSGRGVPDVAADADPRTGYRVRVDGVDAVYGGTSAVAPLWAALAARLNQASGSRLGLAAPRFYAGAAPDRVQPGFRDITVGNNGAYRAGPGWDACTGLGVPIGSALARR